MGGTAIRLAVTPRVAADAIIFAAVLGLVRGLFPALRAARLPVTRALRATRNERAVSIVGYSARWRSGLDLNCALYDCFWRKPDLTASDPKWTFRLEPFPAIRHWTVNGK
jgi:hypothetical protein